MTEEYICPECGEVIQGARYSSPRGMVCEDCDEKLWREEFKDSDMV